METDLSEPVTLWLESRGYTPYAEVAEPGHFSRFIDLVGRKGRELVCVELKTSLTKGVIHQAATLELITPLRYAAVLTQPRRSGIERCRKLGLGLLVVREGELSVVIEPVALHNTWPYYVENMHRNLDVHTPRGIAGHPTRKGEGPAQECYDRVQLYLADQPGATWKEIWEKVHNHYSHPNSMRSAMKLVGGNRRRAALTTEAKMCAAPSIPANE